MAALNSLNLIVNISDPNAAGLLSSFAASTPASVPRLFDSNTLGVSLRAVQPSSSASQPWQDVDLSADTVTMGVGVIGAQPTAGTWTLSFNGFTTAPLAYNIGALALQVAINALTSIIALGSVVVTSQGEGLYVITMNQNGVVAYSFTSAANLLVPTSQVNINTITAGSVSTPGITTVQLAVSLYALNATWTTFPSAAAVVTNLQTGTGSAPSIQQVALNPTPYAGNFALTTSILTTGAIPFNASAAAVQAALNTGGNNYAVSGNAGGPWVITTVANGAVAAITVNVAGLTVPLGLLGTLALNTLNMLFAFTSSGANQLNLYLEIEVNQTGNLSTILQVPIVVTADVINGSSIIPTPVTPYFLALLNLAVNHDGVVISQATLAAVPTKNGGVYGILLVAWKMIFVNEVDGAFAANPAAQTWMLVPGTFATGGKYQRPNDYNASTNAVVWMLC